jgi:hypothetical protein
VITAVGKISKKPVDPLTGNEYVYSLATSKKEFQIKADMEEGLLTGYNSRNNVNENTGRFGGNGLFASIIHSLSSSPDEIAGIVVPDVFAASPTSAYLKGNFNGVFTKTSSGGIVYLYATPSLITNGV